MDFAQLPITILGGFIGSFFGFGFALLTNLLWEKKKRKEDIKKEKMNIENELMYISTKFHDNGDIKKNIISSEVFYSTPVWDSLISTGDILTIGSESNIKSKETKNENSDGSSYYDLVMSAYRKLDEMEQLEKIYGHDREKNKVEIINARKEILSSINNITKEMSIIRESGSSNRSSGDERKEFYDIFWQHAQERGITHTKNYKTPRKGYTSVFEFSTKNLDNAIEKINDPTKIDEVPIIASYKIDMRKCIINIGLGAFANENTDEVEKEKRKNMISEAFSLNGQSKKGSFDDHYGGTIKGIGLDLNEFGKDEIQNKILVKKLIDEFLEIDKKMFG